MKPLISIIIPVYKVEKYLRKCIESIINQTYKNLEIILINDGSPDNCGNICDEYAKTDKRIIVIHQKNCGVSAARNKGLDIMSGAYVMFVDSDDWIESYTIEKAVQATQKYMADLICFDFIRENEGDDKKNQNRDFEILIKETEEEILDIQKKILARDISPLINAISPVWTKLYEKNLALSARFNTDLKLGEDIIYSLNMVLNCKKIVYINATMYHYINIQSSAVNIYREDYYKEIDKFLKIQKMFVKDKEFYDCYLAGISLTVALVTRNYFKKCKLSEFKKRKDLFLKIFDNKDCVIALKTKLPLNGIKAKLIVLLLRYRLYFLLWILFKLG